MIFLQISGGTCGIAILHDEDVEFGGCRDPAE